MNQNSGIISQSELVFRPENHVIGIEILLYHTIILKLLFGLDKEPNGQFLQSPLVFHGKKIHSNRLATIDAYQTLYNKISFLKNNKEKGGNQHKHQDKKCIQKCMTMLK